MSVFNEVSYSVYARLQVPIDAIKEIKGKDSLEARNANWEPVKGWLMYMRIMLHTLD